jgi:hypothetical protein
MRENHCIIIIIIWLCYVTFFRASGRMEGATLEASLMTAVSVPTLPVLQPLVGRRIGVPFIAGCCHYL